MCHQISGIKYHLMLTFHPYVPPRNHGDEIMEGRTLRM